MSEHTPGPWKVCGDGKCSCKTVMSPDFPIAQITHGPWGDDYPAIRLVGTSSLDTKAEAYLEQITYGDVPEPVARANALLIAAAPDMLAELKGIGHQTTITTEHFNRLQRLIAKAEGSSAELSSTEGGR